MHFMGHVDTTAVVQEGGAEPTASWPVGGGHGACGCCICACVVHAVGVDLTADLVGQLGLGMASRARRVC